MGPRKRPLRLLSKSVFSLLALAGLATAPARADGEVDLGFGFNGIAVVPRIFDYELPSAMAVAPDGKIVIGGLATSSDGPFIVRRLERDGDLDGAFLDFSYSGLLRCLLVQPDGRIVVVWDNNTDGTAARIGVIRLLPTGNPDPSFNSGAEKILDLPLDGERARAALLAPGGKLFIASNGQGTGILNGRPVMALTRLLDNGDPDGSWQVVNGTRLKEWNPSPEEGDGSWVDAIALDGSDRLILAGHFRNSGFGTDLSAIGRLDLAGGFDSSFAGIGRNFVSWSGPGYPTHAHQPFGVAVLRDGGLLLASDYTRTDVVQERFGTARFTDAGILDTTYGLQGLTYAGFEVGTTNLATAFALDAADRPVIAGIYSDQVTTVDYGVARLEPGGAGDPYFFSDGNRIFSLNSGSGDPDGAQVMALHTDGGILIAGATWDADGMGGLTYAMVVVRLKAGLPFTDGFESGGTSFWSVP